MNDLPIVDLLERILDSKWEPDKWMFEAGKAYVRLGGKRLELIAPTARQRIAAIAESRRKA